MYYNSHPFRQVAFQSNVDSRAVRRSRFPPALSVSSKARGAVVEPMVAAGPRPQPEGRWEGAPISGYKRSRLSSDGCSIMTGQEVNRRLQYPASTGSYFRSEGGRMWCQNCEARLMELKRRAIGMMINLYEQQRSGKLELMNFSPDKNIQNSEDNNLYDVLESSSLTARIYENLHLSPYSSVENCCEVCSTHISQLKNEAVNMVQSLELGAIKSASAGHLRATVAPSRIPTPVDGSYFKPHHPLHRHQLSGQPSFNGCAPNSYESPAVGHSGKVDLPPPSQGMGNNRVNSAIGYSRVPSPMPRIGSPLMVPNGSSRMSRQGKSPSQANTPSSGSSSPSSGGVPSPVAQQAQQYLEQNIKAWMKPPNQQGQGYQTPLSRDVPLVHSYPKASSSSASVATASGIPGITQKALQEHNLAHLQASASSKIPIGLAVPQTVQPPPSGGPGFPLMCAAYLPTSTSFPHSLAFSGYSQHSLIQGTSYSSPCGSMLRPSQPSAAASFFARAAQRLNLSSKKKRRHHSSSDPEPPPFRTNFCEILRVSPPPAPPGLLRISSRRDGGGIGKVKVMVRICPSHNQGETGASFLTIDSRKKQMTVYDPSACGLSTPAERRVGVSAPKMFAFDAIFPVDDSQTEICSGSLVEVIQAAVNGTDGCLFVYGHSRLGKTYTMVGNSDSTQKLGVIPCAVAWLFKLINEQKQKTGARFSVRVSAVELVGRNETLKDLLAEHATGTEGSGTSPGVYLRDDPIFGTQLTNQSELRAPTAEKAAFLLDAALAARTGDSEDDGRNSHFLFTLHVYQYRVEKGGKTGVAGGRSRLHLFDLGSCDKQAKARDGATGGSLSLSALGNVILALFNGQKHVPYKDSKLTQLLREALGSLTCRAAMIAHVSSSPAHYSETLSTIQLAARIHRMRRKKFKFAMASSGESSSEERGLCRPYVRMHAIGEEGVRSGSSDPDYTSSSEQSCDTVIYVGARVPIHDRDLTDNESPPSVLPIIPKPTAPGPSSKATGKSAMESSNAGTDNVAQDTGGVATATKSAAVSSPLLARSAMQKASLSSTSYPTGADGSPNRSPAHGPQHQKEAKSNASHRTNVASSATHTGSPQHSYSPAKSGSNDVSDPAQGNFPPATVVELPRKINVKHRSSGHSKQQQQQQQQQQQENTANGQATSGQGSSKGAPKDSASRLQSDETWIDGPRFTKPKFDSRTLQQLQKELWVDGPAMYGYMDDHKQDMIQKWVEDHSRHVQDNIGRTQKEVWIDFPPPWITEGLSQLKEKNRGGGGSQDAQKGHPAATSTTDQCQSAKTGDYTQCQNQDGTNKSLDKSGSHQMYSNSSEHPTMYILNGAYGTTDGGSLTDAEKAKQELMHLVGQYVGEYAHQAQSMESSVEQLRNLSEASEVKGINSEEMQSILNKSRQVVMEYAAESEDEQDPETIEVMEPEEPVQMQDSCLQVTEEDIMAACWIHDDSSVSENPLPEVDQESYEGNDHPLHILSEEDLHLPSSFTDSRSVSVDLDSISVPDTSKGHSFLSCSGVTWRLMHSHFFQERREQKLKKDGGEDLSVTIQGDVLAKKLERIAKLRESSIFGRKKTAPADSETEVPLLSSTVSKTCSLPAGMARLTMSDMLYGSKDSSMEDLVETDVNSIHSEPAELDIDKYDLKFNVKPMNGLKLEAFYNRIYKSSPFLEHSMYPKPTQVVPPLITNFAKRSPKKQSLYDFPEIVKNDPIGLQSQKVPLIGGSVENSEEENEVERRAPSVRSNIVTSLRHPDGSSNPHLNKHPSMTQLTVDTTSRGSPSKSQRSPGNGASMSDGEDQVCLLTKSATSCSIVKEAGKCSEKEMRAFYSKEDQSYKSPHIPPTTKMSKLSRFLSGRHGVDKEAMQGRPDSSPSKRSKSASKDSPKLAHKTSHVDAASACRSPSKVHGNSGITSYEAPAFSNSKTSKLATRSSPTSSSSGVVTTCCSPSRSKGAKSKHLSPKPLPKVDKRLQQESKKSQKGKSLCRSTSTPSDAYTERNGSPPGADACSGGIDNSVQDSRSRGPDSRAAIPSNCLPSPYTKVTKARLIHHSSSGHGSDSSVNSSADLMDGRGPTGKSVKTQQLSGTSSGYESTMRDSEGTPISSSSQDSGSEGLSEREGRSRKGTRKKNQGSGQRSLSAPARAPGNGGRQRSPPPVDVQPMPVRGDEMHRWNNSGGRLRKSEDEVCCTGLLCCRILEFY